MQGKPRSNEVGRGHFFDFVRQGAAVAVLPEGLRRYADVSPPLPPLRALSTFCFRNVEVHSFLLSVGSGIDRDRPCDPHRRRRPFEGSFVEASNPWLQLARLASEGQSPPTGWEGVGARLAESNLLSNSTPFTSLDFVPLPLFTGVFAAS